MGTLTLQDNALAVITDDLSIGRFGDPTNSAQGNLLMTGGKLVVTNFNTSIWVGREGIGQMTVSNGMVQARGLLVAAVPTNTAAGIFTLAGGQTIVSSNFVVGDAGLSTGKVFVIGGTMSVTNDNGSALGEIASGMMTMDGGTVELDMLLLTNSTGALIFNSGTLRSRSTIVSNDLPFVVGDGLKPATLELLGGTHVFVNGLTISPNATLSGCGTIIGTINNQGTIATNCGVVPGPPWITKEPVSLVVTQGATATFTVEATGDALSYQWRFGIPGTGGGNVSGATNSILAILSVQTTNAGNYRVIITNASGSATSTVATLKVLVPTALTNISLVETTFSFSFQTVKGLSYTIEFKDNLSDASWTPLSTMAGTGAALNFSDLVGTASSRRFYRITVQ